MRAECYLTSNGCFARADQLRSINNRRRKRRKKKESKITLPRQRVSAHESSATLSEGPKVWYAEGGVRSSPETFKAARERQDGNRSHFMENCTRGVQMKKQRPPPPPFFASPFPIFRVNCTGHYPAISDSFADCYACRNRETIDFSFSKE